MIKDLTLKCDIAPEEDYLQLHDHRRMFTNQFTNKRIVGVRVHEDGEESFVYLDYCSAKALRKWLKRWLKDE